VAVVLAFSGSAVAQTPAKATTATKSAATAAPTAKDISDATARGDVWLNTNTKVYLKAGDKDYGTTKQGKFMSEADAQKAGGRLSGSSKKSTTKKATTK
jgi:hypothetical protein